MRADLASTTVGPLETKLVILKLQKYLTNAYGTELVQKSTVLVLVLVAESLQIVRYQASKEYRTEVPAYERTNTSTYFKYEYRITVTPLTPLLQYCTVRYRTDTVYCTALYGRYPY